MSLQAPRGTRDILAPESARLRALVDAFATAAELGGYGQVLSPMFEQIEVFRRVGEATDIVSKEMYRFRDPGDRHLALRPELTASLARAFVQHRPALPWKAWYEGPQFRYEKPQAGRFRQFNQVGAELFGSDDPQADVDVIALAWRFCTGLGLRRLRLVVNSLGDRADREAYLAALAAYFEGRAGELSAQGRETLDRNPLRLLDSKRAPDRAVVADAPVIDDHWSTAAAEHFAAVLGGLEALGIPSNATPGWCAGWTTTAAPPSSWPPTRSTAPRTRSAAAVATTVWWPIWAVPTRRAWASPSAWTACCWPATPRTPSRRPLGLPTCSWWT